MNSISPGNMLLIPYDLSLLMVNLKFVLGSSVYAKAVAG
eukprot:CAMPEP_0114575304 /NCGR_PEP_ID=MMETSP0125-20121206/187_1 /TAXON_ID=485358 ORGANISM="Aristerostoma sp., Strain ATCC 50986" /NCGR_SAMPLE_ID=MMETSP0125 /ASSEMBLY_ACC=CAM_ASM_000245 /LENGTH=38 /DNA_ID= /DNA_START= /DNA_END= /DNA_ORIENTATION=